MNEEIKEQAHKEFEEKKLVTGAMWLVKMWEKNKNNTEIEIELPEHIKDEFRYFIDSLIDKTVQMTEERIVGVISDFYIMKGGKIDRLPEPEHRMTNLLNENMEIGYLQACRDIISRITNKSDINKEEEHYN